MILVNEHANAWTCQVEGIITIHASIEELVDYLMEVL
jgi:hypothetical protein